jgi:surface antigen
VSDWAIGRIGLTQWRSAQADGPSAPQNAGHYWSGWCLAFASNDWKVAGGDGMVSASSANDAWYTFLGQGRANTSGSRPPRGALVFWDTGTYGHVAISLGNWQAVGTRGYDGDTQPISNYGVDPTGHSLGTFRGWVMPTSNTPYNTH